PRRHGPPPHAVPPDEVRGAPRNRDGAIARLRQDRRDHQGHPIERRPGRSEVESQGEIHVQGKAGRRHRQYPSRPVDEARQRGAERRAQEARARAQGAEGDPGRRESAAGLVIDELKEAAKKYGDERRTLIKTAERATVERAVVEEPVTVILSRKGWIRAR